MSHLTLNQILAYVHGILNEPDALEIDRHLSECDHCAKRIKMHYMLKDHFEDIWNYCVDGEYEKDIKKNILEMTSAMKILSRNPLFKTKCENVIGAITQLFPSPVLNLSPVFGEAESSDIIMLRPFGKIRFPVVFEWEKISSIRTTIVKINEREFSTDSTKIELDLNILPFERDREYEWEIMMIDHEGNQVEGPIGYFLTCNKEDDDLFQAFEKATMDLTVDSEIRYMLNGAMLETNEFYIDAIESYKKALSIIKKPELILRIANCYEELGLKELREKWRVLLEKEIGQ